MTSLDNPEQLGEPDSLPRWIRPKTVDVLVRKHAPDPVPLGVTAGQALTYAWLHAILLWTFVVFFVVVTWKTSTCESDFAKYHWVIWMAAAPVLLLGLSLEMFALSWVIVPKYQVLRQLTLPCKIPAPFAVWLVFQLIVSSTKFANFASDSAFLGTVLKAQGDSDRCGASDHLNDTWEKLWTASMWGGLPCVPLTCLCIVAWATNFVVFFFALGLSCPLSEVDYEVSFNDLTRAPLNSPSHHHHHLLLSGEEQEQDPPEAAVEHSNAQYAGALLTADVRYVTEYKTPLLENQNHGAALMALAETNGMESVVWADLRYALRKAEMVLGKGCDNNSVEHVMSQVRRGCLRTFGAIVTDAFQVNVQLTIFALRAVANDDFWEDGSLVAQPILSFALSILCLCFRFFQAGTILLEVQRFESTRGVGQCTRLHHWKCGLLSACLMTLLVALYALAKLWQVCHCPASILILWGGCVHVK